MQENGPEIIDKSGSDSDSPYKRNYYIAARHKYSTMYGKYERPQSAEKLQVSRRQILNRSEPLQTKTIDYLQ